MICLGIEGTAEKLGVGIVDENGNILANLGRQFYPPVGGIHPREAAQHHSHYLPELLKNAVEKAEISPSEIDLVSFPKGPGLGPCLRTIATAARSVSLLLDIPIVGVNHCIAHIEIGILKTGLKDPVTLYVSGANTQVIAYAGKRYRVFGETLDIGVGNFLDKFGREVGLQHPGGPKIEELARKGEEYIELPYTVKGMDLSFSGLLTASLKLHKKGEELENICFSIQETAFAMLTEVTERAVAHCKKKEVLLCGGVASNKRLQEMIKTMCRDQGVKFGVPERELAVDNGAMIAWLGILYARSGITHSIEETTVDQKYRTDEVDVIWRD
ncbi:MAG: bifunctional N(6)-L-threonylcarbamoyladenine synthase/serine/threonine protein kinase [Candidatus Hydrothermarchaeota archaeon]